MIFLILIIMFGGIAMISWSISSLIQPASPEKKQKSSIQDNAWQVELEKAKTTIVQLQNELEAAGRKESDFTLELEKQKDWNKKDELELEKVKQENTRIKESLIQKEKELEKEFALNLSLNRGLKDNKEQLETTEKGKKQLQEEAPLLKAEIKGLEKEIARLNAVIAEQKKKEVESEWISKQEYNALKKQLEEKEEELRKRGGF